MVVRLVFIFCLSIKVTAMPEEYNAASLRMQQLIDLLGKQDSCSTDAREIIQEVNCLRQRMNLIALLYQQAEEGKRGLESVRGS